MSWLIRTWCKTILSVFFWIRSSFLPITELKRIIFLHDLWINQKSKMKFITSLFGTGSPKAMGRQYMKVGRNALFGLRTDNSDNICTEKVPRPLSFLISKKGKLRHGELLHSLFYIIRRLMIDSFDKFDIEN